jgi:hypothetical protein
MSPVARKPRPVDAPAGEMLVGRPATDAWLSELPPAPQGADVTVSLTDATAAIRHAAELAALGYRSVGVAGCGREDAPTAHFLVPRALALVEAQWLRTLLGAEGRLYEPSMGPVRLVFAPVLAAHRG